MPFHLYTVLLMTIVAACVNSCFAITEEQKAAIKEKLTAIAIDCGTQHGFTIDQLKGWKEAKKTPDDTNKCFFACMFRKTGMLNDQGLFDENTTLEKIKPYLSEARKDGINASVKICTSVNAQSVGDGTAGCDRAVLLHKCLQEQSLLGFTLEQ